MKDAFCTTSGDLQMPGVGYLASLDGNSYVASVSNNCFILINLSVLEGCKSSATFAVVILS